MTRQSTRASNLRIMLETDMKFRDLIYKHLAHYKVNVLGVEENGTFPYRGRDIPKLHILPVKKEGDSELNILERYRASFFASNYYSEKKRHRFFHHLNSSQALCINLFYPLIAEDQCEIFLQYLDIPSGTNLDFGFEKESDIEKAVDGKSVRRTSFDFYIRHSEVHDVFVEVKYTEDGFARAKCDDDHVGKFRGTYLRLVEKSPFLVPECKKETIFLDHYQILRNLVHISEKSHAVFLFPSANTVVSKQAREAKEQFLNDAGKARFKIVYLDEFVSFLEARYNTGPLNGYYGEFRAKYLPF
jgi:hypothetical protein